MTTTGSKNRNGWKRVLCAAIAFCVAAGVHAQDLHFSQFFEAPLLRNPALAGIFTGDVRVEGIYRNQWNSFTNAYRSGSLSGEYKMPVGKGNDFITGAMQLLFDRAGTAALTTTHLLPAVNYHKSLSDEKAMYLAVGFMGGLVQKRIDRSKITTNNQYDGAAFNPSLADGETFLNASYSYLDASFGASFNTTFGENEKNSFYAGAGFHHLNRPSNSFYRTTAALHPKYVFSGGIKLAIDEYTSFTLQADQSVQGSFNETIGGALYSFAVGGESDNPAYTLHAGAFLRWKDALIPIIKIDYNPLAIALSYDVNVSQLKTASQGRGGFELSVSYIGFLNRDNSSKNKILCPRF